eukprot:CAMPEP_0185313518 /NCGR_PEP_ID=MMETSP1363-20130426/35951_1 /TAXON_ID=38817 /ORGANISM="Gephyrocapsa oceanica, Strain RCC1303" /LENGTH=76 /DNA_ID=CAMNT_0027911443 /DNA_START=84 /DNA_END=311 /DNA_ORIENTATION=-
MPNGLGSVPPHPHTERGMANGTREPPSRPRHQLATPHIVRRMGVSLGRACVRVQLVCLGREQRQVERHHVHDEQHL